MDKQIEQFCRIKELCEINGISIAKLSAEISIPKSTFTGVKNGRVKSFSTSTIKKISDYFGVSADYIISGKTPDAADEHKPTDDDIKVALFDGDKDVTPEMWDEVKKYARYLLETNKRKDEDNDE